MSSEINTMLDTMYVDIMRGQLRCKLHPAKQLGAVIGLDGIPGVGKSTFVDFVETEFGPNTPINTRTKNVEKLVDIILECAQYLQSHSEGVDWLTRSFIMTSRFITQFNLGNIKVFKEIPSPVLRDNFYANQEDWAWTFQNVQQRKCLESSVDANHHAMHYNSICFIDRSLYGNSTFESLQYHAQNISPEEHMVYKVFNETIFSKFPLDVLVLLDSDVKDCFNRLKERQKRTNESIPPDVKYLSDLRGKHQDIIGYSDDNQINHHLHTKNVYDSLGKVSAEYLSQMECSVPNSKPKPMDKLIPATVKVVHQIKTVETAAELEKIHWKMIADIIIKFEQRFRV